MAAKYPDKYCFPAVFTYEDGKEISVVFPDLNCATSGVDDMDAFRSAQELLQLVMLGAEEDGEIIPKPSSIKDIKRSENENVSLIEVYMPDVRNEHLNLDKKEAI